MNRAGELGGTPGASGNGRNVTRALGYLEAAAGWMTVAMQAARRAAECYELSVDARAKSHAEATRAWADEKAKLRYLLRVEQVVLERLERQRSARAAREGAT